MKIDNYILERLRVDAAHTIAAAKCEDAIQHAGLRGRLREVLIANLLGPWLPPFCKCVTGMIIESKNKTRKSTQDDILVIDTSIAPPVLANVNGPDGAFPLNSVLLRIEVKSKITLKGFAEFVDASAEVANMEFTKQPNCNSKFTQPHSVLVAFGSNSKSTEWDFEYHRFRKAMKKKKCPPLNGVVSAICVVERGLWFLKDFGKAQRNWCRLDSDTEEDRLVRLVAKVSNTAYRAHAERQGRDHSKGLEIGIGDYLPNEEFLVLDD